MELRFPKNLNTSHVILYPRSLLLPSFPYTYLNTSHVILYLEQSLNTYELTKFKYISCYSLSEQRHSWIFFQRNLNTSHVILYHRIRQLLVHTIRNLNTSHVILYLLSIEICQSMGEFKYISCYSLSYNYNTLNVNIQIFKYISCYSLSKVMSVFKPTFPEFKYISCYSLSFFIHSLSLLCKVFKYISCYSLSCC